MHVVALIPRRRHLVVAVLVVCALVLLLVLLAGVGPSTGPRAPRITSTPADGSPTAVFSFDGQGTFECAVDSVRFVPCRSPVSYGILPVGRHVFMVRGVANGADGDLATYQWVARVGTPRGTGGRIAAHPAGSSRPLVAGGLSFSIEGDLPGRLSPGSGGAIPLRIGNPHPYPITVSGVQVTIDAGSSREGCDGRVDLGLRQSNSAGGAIGLLVPANATVTLPAQGVTAPLLWMRDRPVNQDACKGARFAVRYGGVARKASDG